MIAWSSTFLGCKEKENRGRIKLVWECNTLFHSFFVSYSLQFFFSIFAFSFLKMKLTNLFATYWKFSSSTNSYSTNSFQATMYIVSFSSTSAASSCCSIQRSSSSKLLFQEKMINWEMGWETIRWWGWFSSSRRCTWGTKGFQTLDFSASNFKCLSVSFGSSYIK